LTVERHRGSGVLLHPTSLPGRWGIGDLGGPGRDFADWLAAAGQSWWQVLPLGPTGYGNSPYMCFSALAGNPNLVSPESLVEEGLLDPAALRDAPRFAAGRVDYGAASAWKRQLLERSFAESGGRRPGPHRDGLQAFRERHAAWLEDYALFMALKERNGGGPWTEWPAELARREPCALQDASRELRPQADFHCYAQYLFFHQWKALREYCAQRGVRIIGDLPIYIAHDSAEVWASPELFYLDGDGHPSVVAGVPPDYFSATGQRWGNPIYRWAERARTEYRWWVERFRMNLELVDVLRLDHFRGFEAYWEIPAAEPDAIRGRWVKGPGEDLFTALRRALGDLPVIAEDLGVITPEVEELRDQFGLPGMRILQMAFGGDPKARDYQPHNYVEDCVVYTATHDHNTTVGWFTNAPGAQTTQSREEVEQERALALAYLDSDGHEIHWDMIRLAMGSVARLAVYPLQDVLGLGSESRMNLPGTGHGNWEWRFEAGALTPELAARLAALADLYGRRPTDTRL
jgi:4-alpha-glucanotransferase